MKLQSTSSLSFDLSTEKKLSVGNILTFNVRLSIMFNYLNI